MYDFESLLKLHTNKVHSLEASRMEALEAPWEWCMFTHGIHTFLRSHRDWRLLKLCGISEKQKCLCEASGGFQIIYKQTPGKKAWGNWELPQIGYASLSTASEADSQKHWMAEAIVLFLKSCTPWVYEWVNGRSNTKSDVEAWGSFSWLQVLKALNLYFKHQIQVCPCPLNVISSQD